MLHLHPILKSYALKGHLKEGTYTLINEERQSEEPVSYKRADPCP